MPPEGYSSITVLDEVLEQVIEVMSKYECESTADAVAAASAIAFERDDATLAQLLARRFAE